MAHVRIAQPRHQIAQDERGPGERPTADELGTAEDIALEKIEAERLTGLLLLDGFDLLSEQLQSGAAHEPHHVGEPVGVRQYVELHVVGEL